MCVCVCVCLCVCLGAFFFFFLTFFSRFLDLDWIVYWTSLAVFVFASFCSNQSNSSKQGEGIVFI